MIITTKQGQLTDEVENLRAERIALLGDNKQPISMYSGAKFVVHLIPSSAFDAVSFHPRLFDLNQENLKPMAVGYWNSKINFDGFAAVSSPKGESESYIQVFHNGSIEAVNVSFFHRDNDKLLIPISEWEEVLSKRIGNYVAILNELMVTLPIYAMLSLLGVKGSRLVVTNSYPRSVGHEIDRDNLLIPPVSIDSFDSQIDEILSPALNRIWNAAGLRRP